jgi:hypothetical protein
MHIPSPPFCAESVQAHRRPELRSISLRIAKADVPYGNTGRRGDVKRPRSVQKADFEILLLNGRFYPMTTLELRMSLR